MGVEGTLHHQLLAAELEGGLVLGELLEGRTLRRIKREAIIGVLELGEVVEVGAAPTDLDAALEAGAPANHPFRKIGKIIAASTALLEEEGVGADDMLPVVLPAKVGIPCRHQPGAFGSGRIEGIVRKGLAGHVVEKRPVGAQVALPGVLERGRLVRGMRGVVTGLRDFHAKLGKVELFEVARR